MVLRWCYCCFFPAFPKKRTLVYWSKVLLGSDVAWLGVMVMETEFVVLHWMEWNSVGVSFSTPFAFFKICFQLPFISRRETTPGDFAHGNCLALPLLLNILMNCNDELNREKGKCHLSTTLNIFIYACIWQGEERLTFLCSRMLIRMYFMVV